MNTMQYAIRSSNRPLARRKSAAEKSSVKTTVVADHIARTLLHQGYAELDEAEQGVVDRIVAFAPHPAPAAPKASLLDRIADRIAEVNRSWWFVTGFALTVGAWMLMNSASMAAQGFAFDPYPYDLLRFALMMVASVQGPIVLISQQRRATVDRAAAEYNAAIAVHSELEILRLHKRLDGIERGLLPQARASSDARAPSLRAGTAVLLRRQCCRRGQSPAQ